MFLAGCGDSRITDPSAPVDARPYVTGAAAANLGSGSLFTLNSPTSPSTLPIVSPERARELAQAFVLSYGPTLKQWWDQDHGAPLDLARLEPDSRPFYGPTAYELFPEGFHPTMHRAYGPYYLVRMGWGTRYPLMVAVSGYSTHVLIMSNGKLHIPGGSGMEFLSRGIPADTTGREYYSLISPEAAVVRVARGTGTRVSEVPEYVLSEARMGPYGGLWKLTLERPVRVRTVTDARTVDVRHVYVGRESGRQLLIPAAQQPTEVTVSALRGVVGDDVLTETVTLPVRAGQPTIFEEVVPVSP